MNMEQKTDLIEAARPYLPGLPPYIELIPWQDTGIEDPAYLGLAYRNRPAIALRPGLEGEALERVLLHELIHLAEPLLSEDWVRALEPILHHAIRQGLPPRDLPSLAWLSVEELEERLLPGLPQNPDPNLFPGRLGAFWHAIGVIPTEGLAENPLYLLQQVAAGLSYGITGWVLERLWPKPLTTRREAAIALAWRAATALDEEWRRVEELLGRDGELFPMEVHPGQLWYIPVPEERRSLVLSLVDAILDGPGEAYEPPEAGLPEEVVAGMLASGRL